MRPKAQTLFHFTRDVETLKKILLGGFWPRYSDEDFEWQAVGEHSISRAAIPMVCFCDIPLSRIDEHVDFYGRYGVGLSREWGERNDLNPVIYISPGNTLARSLILLADVARDQGEANAQLASTYAKHAASFMKPVSGLAGPRDGDRQYKDFYQESEWRFVPAHSDIPQLLLSDQFNDQATLFAANEKTKRLAMLEFSPADVRYIFVKEDAEIPEMITFIQANFDQYSGFDAKVLMSRVTSLQTIGTDL